MGRHSGKHRAPGGWRGPPTSLLLSLGSATAVVVIVLVAVALAKRGSTPSTQRPPKLPTVPQPSLLPGHSPSPTVSPTVLEARPTVLLSWTGGQSWIRVTDADRRVLLVGVQPRFSVQKFTGRSFVIEIGDGGKVTVSIHGGAPHLAGQPGQVVRFTVTGP